MTRRISNPVDRFLAKIEKTDTCWLWRGSIGDTGYGNMYRGRGPRRVVSAHRFSYEHFVGPIPEGLTIDHLCRVRACVNPEHLEAVSYRENVLRGTGWSAINAAKTHCPQGHPYDFVARRSDGGLGRRCRTCRREQFRRADAKRRALGKR